MKKQSTLASIKRESDLEWCDGVATEYGEESYSEEDFRMVETASQPSPRSQPSAVFSPHQFLGNVFLGEGFKPVYKTRGPATSASGSSTSLFTIDSILAPRPKPSSPQRPMMQHPNIHLGHIAAAASAGFGASSADFLGKLFSLLPIILYLIMFCQI